MSDGALHPPLEFAQREAMRALVKVMKRNLEMSYAEIGRVSGVDGEWLHNYANQRNRTGGRRALNSEDEDRVQRLCQYLRRVDRTVLSPAAKALLQIVLDEHLKSPSVTESTHSESNPYIRSAIDVFSTHTANLISEDGHFLGRMKRYRGFYTLFRLRDEKLLFQELLYIGGPGEETLLLNYRGNVFRGCAFPGRNVISIFLTGLHLSDSPSAF